MWNETHELLRIWTGRRNGEMCCFWVIKNSTYFFCENSCWGANWACSEKELWNLECDEFWLHLSFSVEIWNTATTEHWNCAINTRKKNIIQKLQISSEQSCSHARNSNCNFPSDSFMSRRACACWKLHKLFYNRKFSVLVKFPYLRRIYSVTCSIISLDRFECSSIPRHIFQQQKKNRRILFFILID